MGLGGVWGVTARAGSRIRAEIVEFCMTHFRASGVRELRQLQPIHSHLSHTKSLTRKQLRDLAHVMITAWLRQRHINCNLMRASLVRLRPSRLPILLARGVSDEL